MLACVEWQQPDDSRYFLNDGINGCLASNVDTWSRSLHALAASHLNCAVISPRVVASDAESRKAANAATSVLQHQAAEVETPETLDKRLPPFSVISVTGCMPYAVASSFQFKMQRLSVGVHCSERMRRALSEPFRHHEDWTYFSYFDSLVDISDSCYLQVSYPIALTRS